MVDPAEGVGQGSHVQGGIPCHRGVGGDGRGTGSADRRNPPCQSPSGRLELDSGPHPPPVAAGVHYCTCCTHGASSQSCHQTPLRWAELTLRAGGSGPPPSPLYPPAPPPRCRSHWQEGQPRTSWSPPTAACRPLIVPWASSGASAAGTQSFPGRQ